MKQLKFLVILIIPLLISCNDKSESGNSNNVVAYIAGYRDFDFSQVDATKLTHINYAFANVIDGRVAFDTTPIDGRVLSKSDIDALQLLKKDNVDLKILVSVGGWTWSKNFSDAALTEESREIFAASAAEFVKENNLDGIDIDWEYPNQVGDNNPHRTEDIENFTLLLKACREKLDAINPELLLTIATGADEAYLQNTRLGEAQQYLDFINIMTYDFHNGLHTQTGHHANLFKSEYDVPDGSSIIKSVQMHIDAGVPPDKINLGIPFYGRYWGKVNPENNGLYSEAGTTGMIMYYRIIKDDKLTDSSYIRYWDDSAMVPWLWNNNDSIFISYEDTESIRHKMDYVRDMGLGGIMFWEYSDNPDGELLHAISNHLNK